MFVPKTGTYRKHASHNSLLKFNTNQVAIKNARQLAITDHQTYE